MCPWISCYKARVVDENFMPVTDFSPCAGIVLLDCQSSPPSPTNFTATTSPGKTVVSWQNPCAPGTCEFWLYEGDIAIGAALWLTTNGTSYTMVAPGTHTLSVIAVDPITRCPSTPATVTYTAIPNCTSAPPAPADLAVTRYYGGGPLKYLLTWTASSGAVKYNIYRAAGTENNYYEYIGESQSPLYLDSNNDNSGFPTGLVVKYTVTAVDATGCESPSSYELDRGLPETTDESAITTFYITDHLGTVRLVLDNSGRVESRHDYEPFGAELAPEGITYNRVQYTGQERDYDTGIDYMHARFYGSSMGRFLKPDNIIGNMANPQSWNLYSYVNGNPVNFNDPGGHAMSGKTSPAYMQGSHSFGMSWFDQFYPNPITGEAWSPWAGQTAGNSWYMGATKDAFQTYCYNQYVLGIGASTNLAPANQVGVGPTGQPLTLTSLLLQLGVTQEELVGAIASVVLAFDYVQHGMPVGSEAAMAIARINGEIKVLIAPASIGGSISEQTILDWRYNQTQEYRKIGAVIEILAFGHVHGPGLWPYPSGDPGDTINTINLFNKHSADWLEKYGNMVVLTPEYMWLFNRSTCNWDYAIGP